MGTIRLVAGRRAHMGSAQTLTCKMALTEVMRRTGMYLIVITRKKKVGEILGHAVWKVVDFDVISYKKSVLHLSETQVRVAA